MVRSGRMDIDELPVEHRERLLAGREIIGRDADADADADADGSVLHDDPAFGLDPALATERLYERRGKMFGVLVCHDGAPTTEEEDDDDATGSKTTTVVGKNNNNNNNDDNHHHHHQHHHSTNVVILKAYAGKLGGQWNLPGWSPIIGKIPEDIPEFQKRSDEVSQFFTEIDILKKDDRLATSSSTASSSGDNGTTTMNNNNDALIQKLTKERAIASTLAMQEVRRHQLVTNFRGETQPIAVAFAKVGPTTSSSSSSSSSTRNLPGGTGDCAAPKLLAEAVRRGLRPVGICEIFVGATGGMSTTKGDGEFYDACDSRCEHIAGYMLCGLE